MEERHLSLSEAADALNISERTTYRWIKSGKLRAYKPGRDYWIPESAIKEVVEASAVRPKAEAPSSQGKLFNNDPEEERREDINEVVLEAARQQLKEDAQADARAEESERPQTRFKHHENALAIRLLQYPQGELAGALIELGLRYAKMEQEKELQSAVLLKQLEERAGRA